MVHIKEAISDKKENKEEEKKQENPVQRIKMADDLKKVKRDRGRISLKQKWEVAYLRRIAREQMKKMEQGKPLSKAKLTRLCKALLKALK